MKNYCVKTLQLRYFSSKRPASRGLEPWTLLNEFLYFKLQHICAVVVAQWQNPRLEILRLWARIMLDDRLFLSLFLSLSFFFLQQQQVFHKWVLIEMQTQHKNRCLTALPGLRQAPMGSEWVKKFHLFIRPVIIRAITNFELHFLPVPSKPSSINPFLI